MVETQENERSLFEYVITGLVILFFGGLYYFINHTGGDITGRPVQTVTNPIVAGSAGLALNDTPQANTSPRDTDENVTQAAIPADEQSVVSDEDIAKQQADDAKHQQAMAALEAQKAKFEGEIDLLQADRDNLVETNTALIQKADEVMKQVVVTQQAALAEVAQQQAPATVAKAVGYQLPDGTQVTIADEGFEGLLKQALKVRAINTPIIFDAIYFESGSSEPTKNSQSQITATAALMNGHPEVHVLIKGHTDDTGNSRQNTLLSLTRSSYMKNALVKLGIDARRINVQGVGSLEPIAPNDTEEGRNANRRIELILND